MQVELENLKWLKQWKDCQNSCNDQWSFYVNQVINLRINGLSYNTMLPEMLMSCEMENVITHSIFFQMFLYYYCLLSCPATLLSTSGFHLFKLFFCHSHKTLIRPRWLGEDHIHNDQSLPCQIFSSLHWHKPV